MTIPDTELVRHITQTVTHLDTMSKQMDGIVRDVKDISNKLPYLVTHDQLKASLAEHMASCSYKGKVEGLWPASIKDWLQVMVMFTTLIAIFYGSVIWFGKIDALAASNTQNDSVTVQITQLIDKLNKLDLSPVGNPAPVDPTDN
jgi:hypothetical protein